MDSFDFSAGFEGVSVASIVLGIVFLTVPGVATAVGLTKYRTSKRPTRPAAASRDGGNPRTRARSRTAGRASGAGKKKRGFVAVLASVGTVVALLWAGLGLIPLAKVVYRAIDNKWEYGAAVAGVVALIVLLAKVLAMVHDLKDGEMDHPMLWLLPVPLAAVFVWALPVMWGQMTEQAGHSAEAIFGGSGTSGQEAGSKTSDKPKHEKAKSGGSHAAKNGSHGDE